MRSLARIGNRGRNAGSDTALELVADRHNNVEEIDKDADIPTAIHLGLDRAKGLALPTNLLLDLAAILPIEVAAIRSSPSRAIVR